MIANLIIYTMEVIKYYIISKYFFGYEIKNNAMLNVIRGAAILGFSWYITVSTGNPMGMFLVYIFIEMFSLLNERFWRVILTTAWLMPIISLLDGMFLTVVELILLKTNVSYMVMDCVSSVITTLFIYMLACIIKKRTSGGTFRISKTYLFYFTLLTLVEGVLITALEKFAMEQYGVRAMLIILSCTVIMMINIVIVLFLAISNDGYKQRDILNKMYLKQQEEHYEYLSEKNQDIRKFRHDVKGHMFVLKELIEKNNLPELKKYIGRVEEDIHTDESKVTVYNNIVDAILNKYYYDAKKSGTSMIVEGSLFENCKVEPYDLCVIFDNILKNAVEAASDSEKKCIYVRVERDDDSIQIYAENSCSGKLSKNGKNISYYQKR